MYHGTCTQQKTCKQEQKQFSNHSVKHTVPLIKMIVRARCNHMQGISVHDNNWQ